MTKVTVIASSAGHYVHWGVVSISLTNLLIVVAMVVLFGLALVVPFGPAGGHGDDDDVSQP
jgi:hypothetical protein